MADNLSQPKRIEEITIDDLKSHRWCYYHNDSDGFDAFEHVVSDEHSGFSIHSIELELAEFHFSNGKSMPGIYDGSESFTLVVGEEYLSFWSGCIGLSKQEIINASEFLRRHDLLLPVKVVSKWSKISKVFNGIEYINTKNEVVSIAI